ncbi:putative DNA helicase [Cutaneotrichosporon oleaginosum]|uniref:DNA helicase n=1 Tax=Cutaneotrichosporon oleaginosum TaxID=879819 RepID=A0A0J0XWB6_9TREE|nr:putative DNA helicase [Cutaneotrichosporon oleaginosum]KLT45382.1 putative DNA helicase [Cutaneotrichosporon oleaginosum]TXT14653.1 hypothetical protein COLE_00846 [Cutaneotrichosporon oleaginosum]
MAALLETRAPTEAELEAFFSRHEELLAAERAEEEEQTRLLNTNCSPKLLESKGLALGSLGVASISVGLGGKTLVELCRPIAYNVDTELPLHTFRNGDPARIEEIVPEKKGKKAEAAGVDGVVYRVGRDKIVVAVSEGDVELPERLRLLKLANSATYDRMRRTLEHLRRLVLPGESTPNAANWPLINALLGISPPTWSTIPPPLNGDGMHWYSSRLNDSQKEAIEFCLRADTLACIHGPPGTGKTHTLIEVIFQLLARPAGPETTQPPRILVTAPSNLALDNLLLRLHTLAQLPDYAGLLPPGSILRLGHPTRVNRDLVRETLDWRAANGEEGALVRDVGKEIEGHLSDLGRKRGEKGAVKGRERGNKWQEVRELRKEYRQREAKVVTNTVRRARVVLATCHTAGARQLNNMQFDVAIVDEATQAVEAVCWVPILKSKKLILAGDPQQLPPTILSKDTKGKRKEKKQKVEGAKKTMPEAKETAVASEEDGPVSEADSSDGDEQVVEASKKLAGISVKAKSLRPPHTLETTLFDRLERLYGPGVKRVLKVQYRMNERIAAFPSATLYGGELVSDESVAHRTLLDLPTASDSDDARDVLEHPVVFFDTDGCEFYERSEADDVKSLGEGSKANENEAVVVAAWARKLVQHGVAPAEVGIVVPYQAQVSVLAGMLRDEYPEMTIGTVDGLQGQERDAVILSLVRSNEKGEVGFLGEHRRLNVAMTRPRMQLCVVGDSSTVAKGSAYLKKWMAWLEENADVRYAGDEV